MLAIARLLILSLAGANALPVIAGGPTPITLSAEQIAALGVGTEVVAPTAAAVPARYPAKVGVPVDRQRVVAVPLAAVVEAVLVAPGDAVRAGQPLARLRSAPIQELQRDAMQSASQAELARAAFDRDQRLLDEGVISRSRFEATRAAHQQATTQYEERRRQLSALGGVDASRLDGIQVLHSPIGGVVMESVLVPGQRIEAAMALLKIASLDTLVLELQVPASEVGALHLGDGVRVPGSTAKGHIVGIGHAVDPSTQSVVVRAQLRSEARPALRPGQLSEAIVERRAAAARRIASSAVVRHDGREAVFVEEAPGRFRLIHVRVGGSNEGSAVVEGLEAGLRVVVKGTAALLSLAQS